MYSTVKNKTVKLKICGMKYPDNIRQVAMLQPDYMGFIFWEKSPRFFDGNIPELPDTIKKTGVFVNADFHDIVSTVQQHRLQAIQLHGQESPELCRQLKTHYAGTKNIEIIKVFSIEEDLDFSVLAPYETACNYFLFDSKGKLPGGNGYTFNWEVLKNYPSQNPFFLSGGIGLEEAEKIKTVLKTTLPVCAIDVNSQFEIQPGLKNIETLNAFITSLLK